MDFIFLDFYSYNVMHYLNLLKFIFYHWHYLYGTSDCLLLLAF